MTVRDALQHALAANRGLVRAPELDQARALLDRPWTAAVVGRIGAGKTSLVNRQTGQRRPVGLGGVTRQVERVEHPGGVLLDTPGIDDPYTAVEVLGPVLEEVDAVVWVVDGLQPMTGSEREVLRDTLPDRVPLWVVASRADLVDPGEVGIVLDRVRELAAVHGPVDVLSADLRSIAPAIYRVGAGSPPGVRRADRIRALLGPVRATLAANPARARPDELAARWRDEVRAIIRDVERRIGQGEVRHEVEALALLSSRAAAAIEEVARVAGDPPPPLPLPEPVARTMLDQLLAGLAGAQRARRAVRTVGARWLADGEVAIRDEWPGSAARIEEAAAREAFVRALDRLEAALDRS